jgi:hypothetical protein
MVDKLARDTYVLSVGRGAGELAYDGGNHGENFVFWGSAGGSHARPRIASRFLLAVEVDSASSSSRSAE